ncbi:MAG: hypothetical protein JW795_20180 [Chitinivibrionales bacterium]|nr:hypothetical protein [Chitinivibrionales bacterium]
MARIVYGVAGEGSGHSSRAREMAGHLCRQGHQVKLISYDRGFRNLKDDFDVFETEGLHIASIDNKVDVVKTITDNIGKIAQGYEKAQIIRKTLFHEFKPQAVISDFEPMSAYFANHYELPLITIDNQHRIRYMEYPCPTILKADQIITENIVRAIVPKPDVSLVTTFYFGPVKNKRTLLFPPIIRNEVVAKVPQSSVYANHILVYLTSGFETFLELLPEFFRERFIVYGYDRNETCGNVTYRPFSKNGFLDDLASCKAVMATAGFTLMTESLYLKKPYFAMPMKGQFEQELNGIFLAQLGCGVNCRSIQKEAMAAFLYHIPDFDEQLKSYPSSDNREIKEKLDELFADEAACARQYHEKRKSNDATD